MRNRDCILVVDDNPESLRFLVDTLEAEAGTRGMRRAFLGYDDLLADWRAVADRLRRAACGAGSEGEEKGKG